MAPRNDTRTHVPEEGASQTPASTQLQEFYRFMEDEKSFHLLDAVIPASEDLHFENVVPGTDPKYVKKGLFLGEGADWAAWSYIKVYPNKSTVVEIIVKKLDEDGQPRDSQKLEKKSDFAAYKLMYPFCLFVDPNVKMPNSVKKLKAFIKYYFMESGVAQNLFSAPSYSTHKSLLTAMEVIEREYIKMGGVERVPDLYRPRTFEQALRLEDSVPGQEDAVTAPNLPSTAAEGGQSTVRQHRVLAVPRKTNARGRQVRRGSLASSMNAMSLVDDGVEIGASLDPRPGPSRGTKRKSADDDTRDAEELMREHMELEEQITAKEQELAAQEQGVAATQRDLAVLRGKRSGVADQLLVVTKGMSRQKLLKVVLAKPSLSKRS